MPVGNATKEGDFQISEAILLVLLGITQKLSTEPRNFYTNVRYAFDLKLFVFRCGF